MFKFRKKALRKLRTVVLISSPIALIVALWGMTSERTLQYMRSSGKQMVAIGESAELRAR